MKKITKEEYEYRSSSFAVFYEKGDRTITLRGESNPDWTLAHSSWIHVPKNKLKELIKQLQALDEL